MNLPFIYSQDRQVIRTQLPQALDLVQKIKQGTRNYHSTKGQRRQLLKNEKIINKNIERLRDISLFKIRKLQQNFYALSLICFHYILVVENNKTKITCSISFSFPNLFQQIILNEPFINWSLIK